MTAVAGVQSVSLGSAVFSVSRQQEVKEWSQHPDRAVLLGLSAEQSREERLKWLWAGEASLELLAVLV